MIGKKLNIELIKGENIGPALSFWELLTNQEISGDYFSLCDQDDIWDSDKLEVGIKFLKNYSLYCCNCRIIDKNDHIIEQYRKKEYQILQSLKFFLLELLRAVR